MVAEALPRQAAGMTTVAVLGLGAMGSRMAMRLREAGFEVRVYNRTRARAEALGSKVVVCETPREAAEEAEVVLSMVRDDASAEAIWLHPQTGALAAMREGAVAMECSTLSPEGLRRLSAAAQARGQAWVDAPVVGSRPQAEAGALVFLVGGEAETVRGLAPLFEAMGSATHHVGAAGQGMAMKLAVNALFGVQVAAVAELLGSLAHAGIDRAAALEVLGALAVTSPAAKGVGGLMVRRDYAPRFPVALVHKDLGYAVQAAGGAAPMTAAAQAVFQDGITRGLGEQNLVAVADLYP